MNLKSEEMDQKKRVKKSASVRFAAENSSTSPSEDEGVSEQAVDIDIRAEIQNYLPSNTLHRRKQTVFNTMAMKSFTLPRNMNSTSFGRTLSRMRHVSYPTKKRSYFDSGDSSDKPVPSIQKQYEQIQIPSTEEEKLEELVNIRDLPIQMNEKRTYRNAIMNSMKSPQYATKSKKKSFAQCLSSLLKASSSKFELWNRTLKKIEGQFGTGVVSYFVFLRWLILLNFLIFILYFLLIILPYSAFALLPHQIITTAPNTTIFTDEYLEQFKKIEDKPLSRKRVDLENVSLHVSNDLIGDLSTLLNYYAPAEMLDVVNYDKKNYTGEHRNRISIMCKEKYDTELRNRTKENFSFLQDFLQGTFISWDSRECSNTEKAI